MLLDPTSSALRLLRVGSAGAELPVVLTADDTAYDARPVTTDFDPSFFGSNGIERLRDAIAGGQLPIVDIAGERIGAPLTRPSAVLCIGMNYAAHAAESGNSAPEEPVLFYKAPNTLVGPNDTVLKPRGSEKLDWEVELAVVIGKRARYIASPEEALDYAVGYAISNDVSERYLQLEISGGQWSKGKSSETFNPMGPWILVPDTDFDPQGLGLRSFVNGEVRQDSSTRDMVFSVAQLIYELSQFTVLEPGDVINTGTPEGVALSGRFPYLQAGDVMALEIDLLGSQSQEVVDA